MPERRALRFWQSTIHAPADQLLGLARHAEDLGFEGAMGPDHTVWWGSNIASKYPYNDTGDIWRHTAGGYIVVIASGNDRAYLLGDVVQHPLQLNDESMSFLTDLDPALAARTRQRVFDAMEREEAAIGMDHFPGLGFQQIIAGSPRKWLPVR